MTDSWDNLNVAQARYLGQLLVEAHDLRRAAAECDTKARTADAERDDGSVECELRLDAIRGVLSAAGIPERDWLGWECETVLGGPANVARVTMPRARGATLDTRLFGERHPKFSRYVICGVLCLAGDKMGQFTGIDVWGRSGGPWPEVDGVHYRYMYERQEF